jgi:hypothetical protein
MNATHYIYMEFEFSQRMVNLMLHIQKHRFVTRDTRPFLSSFRYYGYIWMLRNAGLIEEEGCNNEHQKKWILTKNGKDFCSHLKELRDLVGIAVKD